MQPRLPHGVPLEELSVSACSGFRILRPAGVLDQLVPDLTRLGSLLRCDARHNPLASSRLISSVMSGRPTRASSSPELEAPLAPTAGLSFGCTLNQVAPALSAGHVEHAGQRMHFAD